MHETNDQDKTEQDRTGPIDSRRQQVPPLCSLCSLLAALCVLLSPLQSPLSDRPRPRFPAGSVQRPERPEPDRHQHAVQVAAAAGDSLPCAPFALFSSAFPLSLLPPCAPVTLFSSASSLSLSGLSSVSPPPFVLPALSSQLDLHFVAAGSCLPPRPSHICYCRSLVPRIPDSLRRNHRCSTAHPQANTALHSRRSRRCRRKSPIWLPSATRQSTTASGGLATTSGTGSGPPQRDLCAQPLCLSASLALWLTGSLALCVLPSALSSVPSPFFSLLSPPLSSLRHLLSPRYGTSSLLATAPPLGVPCSKLRH